MDEGDLADTLDIILMKLKGRSFNWRLDGSANLKLQGVNIAVNDLDIETDSIGIKIFREVFLKYIIRDYYEAKFSAQMIVMNLNGFEVEVFSHDNPDQALFEKVRLLDFGEFKLPILPLKYAKVIYEKRGNIVKVEIIASHLIQFPTA